ncbi:MAG: multiple antibiotic resistance protein [Saprospiraceae bacterium]|jgi:multiple antibiotic resistance protein
MIISTVFTEQFVIALTSLFALIDPIGNAVIFASLTPKQTLKERRKIAFKAVIIASVLMLVFMGLGEFFLKHLGISLAALRTSGGILLLLLGINMVFQEESDQDTDQALAKNANKDITVFPLATPLIAGPGGIGMIILLQANTNGVAQQEIAIVAALVGIMVLTLICLLLASSLQRLFGSTGLSVMNRIMGVLLAALAVQFIFDGLSQSGLF